MSKTPNRCYYYDEQHNRCKCYANENLDELLAENAKLRELVKAFDWCTENFDLPYKCDSCPLSQSDKLTPECEVRMRELEIEAGE